jgi:hypothetical protein
MTYIYITLKGIYTKTHYKEIVERQDTVPKRREEQLITSKGSSIRLLANFFSQFWRPKKVSQYFQSGERKTKTKAKPNNQESYASKTVLQK